MSIKAAAQDTTKGFLNSIACHSFNKDRTQVAICPNTNEIFIFDCSKGTDPNSWVKLHTLTEHSGLVSDLDWSPVNDCIVSCGHDRNGYVWKLDGGEWKPTLCVLRINRAAISVRWSPCGKKFAVTSGSKTIPVCYYEASSDWWVSKMIKKHKSTIVSCAWSPNSRFLITSSTDFKCRIISAFDKSIDSKSSEYDEIFGDKQYAFGEVLAEFGETQAWVNASAWSPNGKTVAFFGHGSTAHFVNLDAGVDKVQTIFLRDYPMLAAEFLSDDVLVAVGFDNNPAIFVREADGWVFKTFAEKPSDSKDAVAKTSSATSKAFAMFQQADSKGTKFGEAEKKKEVFTTHQNTVNCLRRADGTKFSTSGLDGRVIFWDAAKYL